MRSEMQVTATARPLAVKRDIEFCHRGGANQTHPAQNPLPKLRDLRGQWPQPRPVPAHPRQPTESPSCQNSFPFSLTKSSRFQLRNNKHGGRRGNLFPQHFNEENTHGDANAAAVRCLPILLPPGLILLAAGTVQGCAEPPAAPGLHPGLDRASQIGMGCSRSRARAG